MTCASLSSDGFLMKFSFSTCFCFAARLRAFGFLELWGFPLSLGTYIYLISVRTIGSVETIIILSTLGCSALYVAFFSLVNLCALGMVAEYTDCLLD